MAKRQSQKGANQYRFKRKLDAIDWNIIDAVLREPGISDNEVAKKLGYTRSAICKRRLNPAVQLEITELQRDEIEQVLRIRRKAIRRVERIIDHGKDVDAKTVAMKIINGLPEIAAGLLKPEDDTTDKPTADEITALQEYQAETEKRQTTDNKGAS